MKKLYESLKEFNDDGSKFQLATPSEKTWKDVWKSRVEIGKKSVVFIEAGYTSTTENVHTAVINVTVKPLKLENGAEDAGDETITVYYKDFEKPDQAVKALEEFRVGRHINEEDSSVPLGIQLYTQAVAPTIGLGYDK